MRMNAEDPMSPDASPGEVSKKPGVRRVNNLPVYIIGTLMSVFLLVMVLVAADRAAQQNRATISMDEKTGSTSMFAAAIAGDQKDGFISAAGAAAPAVPDLVRPKDGAEDAILIARPDNLEAPPTPPSGNENPQIDQRGIDDLLRIRMMKLQQLEEAVKAKTGVQVIAPRSAASAPGGISGNGAPATREEALARLAAVRQQIDAQTRDNPTAAYQARLQQLQAAGLAGGTSGDGSTMPRQLQMAVASSGGGKDYGQFAGSGQQDRWKLGTQPEAPRSPYELRAGFVVPATLISGINSDLPGQIMAQVSQDVFDTATGKWKLIPQGSRLVGQYSSDVSYGQSRVLIAWQRIVFPDGKAMDIGSMPGADSAGYSGFRDQVNNHYFRLFASAFLMSGVTAGITLSQPQTLNNTTRQSAGSAMSEALGQQLGQVTAQLIARNMNIAPTLEIRPGYRFNVIVTKDMTFSKPYQAFDY
jgi:type IV secretory pathway VirB10-like protein